MAEGLSSVARRQGKSKSAIESDIADALGYSVHTVVRWQRQSGNIPNEKEAIEYLVDYCLHNGRLDQTWANALLESAGYATPSARPTVPEPQVLHDIKAESGLRYLPPRSDLLGRQPELERIRLGLFSRFPYLSIEGLPGAGKTTLAIEVAHRVARGEDWARGMPFTAVVWISAQDRLQKGDWLNEILDTTAWVLGERHILKLPLEEKERAVHGLIGQESKPILVILDSLDIMLSKARSEYSPLEEWIQLVPGKSKVLLTLRSDLALRGESPDQKLWRGALWRTTLHGLEEVDALEFISRHAPSKQLARILEYPDSLRRLVAITGGNPQLILMALGHVKFDTVDALDRVIEHLEGARPQVGDLLQYFIAWTWANLRLDAKQIMMAMSLFRKTASRQALGQVAGLTDYSLDTALEQLSDLSLIELSAPLSPSTTWSTETAVPRYSLHPLTRAYSTAQLQGNEEWAQWANLAYERWLEWHKELAKKAVEPAYYPSLRDDADNLLAVMSWLSEDSAGESGWRLKELAELLRRVQRFLFAEGHWSELHNIVGRVYGWIESIKTSRATEAAEVLIDTLQTYLTICIRRDALDQAREGLEQANALAEGLGNPRLKMSLEAEVLLGQARLMEYNDYNTQEPMSTAEFETRRKNLEEAEAIFRQVEAPSHVMISLNSLGKLFLVNGSYNLARHYFEEALKVLKALENRGHIYGARRWEAIIRGNIAHVIGEMASESQDEKVKLAQFQVAKQILSDIVVDFTDPDDLIEAYVSIAYYERRLGANDEARDSYEQGTKLRKSYGLNRFLCAEDVSWQQLPPLSEEA